MPPLVGEIDGSTLAPVGPEPIPLARVQVRLRAKPDKVVDLHPLQRERAAAGAGAGVAVALAGIPPPVKVAEAWPKVEVEDPLLRILGAFLARRDERADAIHLLLGGANEDHTGVGIPADVGDLAQRDSVGALASAPLRRAGSSAVRGRRRHAGVDIVQAVRIGEERDVAVEKSALVAGGKAPLAVVFFFFA